MTKLKKLKQRLTNAYLVRCRNWGMCGQKSCEHYEPHRTAPYCTKNPYQYCECVKAFVHDIPIQDVDEGECDPNLAFKASKNARNQPTEEEQVQADTEEHYVDWKHSSFAEEDD
jgi:hypothetical protein